MGLNERYKDNSDLFAHYGRQIIQSRNPSLPTLPLPPIIQAALKRGEIPSSRVKSHATVREVTPIGIIGAGVGGLYCGLILQSLGIPFEILESRTRTGGRLYTHKFQKGQTYDYFDVGAMRYPLPPTNESGDYENGVMKRLGELCNYLQLQNKLIPYHFDSVSGPTYQYYNGVRGTSAESPKPDFRAKEMGVSQPYIDVGGDAIMSDVYLDFLLRLQNDIETGETSGWEHLKKFDAYSLRAYLAFEYTPSSNLGLPTPKGLPIDVINWLETFQNSTGSFDTAFTEGVLDAMAFNEFGDEVGSHVDWKCFDGGSQVLSNAMAEKIGPAAIILGATVTSIAPADPSNDDSLMNVTYTAQDGSIYTRQYAHVISTIPLPSLRIMDISQCGLTPMQSTALRMLQYGPSIKIGIRFTSDWWKTGDNELGQKLDIVGGQSSTDLPVRTVVYPSYGHVGQEPSHVLIASYCWTSDAARIAALFKKDANPPYDPRLETVVLSNLATLHNVSLKFLRSQFIEMYPWDWNLDAHTGGAFAYFGPGQFESLYDSLNLPTPNGKLHFASELLSIRHAWVVGALDSSWRAVLGYLLCTQSSKINDFLDTWGYNEEWATSAPSQRDGGRVGHDNNLLLKHLFHRRPHIFEGMETST
ncbi:hypothetical protein M422DRAFT_253129 [Sphaerobolus stellatus SS14]|uniref:Amine oxidase domain-containing protein n=1 Tax=Sphaerobolus stellatus (strain SS14) TaxID=990650 RepID=A0A0C9VYK8_SPHS4|nr:hypothetical protein M422DRAFT_253129 [Sphaerobolus stellatus SS14]